jgi:hypothetical protein
VKALPSPPRSVAGIGEGPRRGVNIGLVSDELQHRSVIRVKPCQGAAKNPNLQLFTSGDPLAPVVARAEAINRLACREDVLEVQVPPVPSFCAACALFSVEFGPNVEDWLLFGDLPPKILQRIARTPATAGVFNQNVPVNQVLDVTKRRVMRALPDLCPLGRSQLSFQSIKHPIQD